MLTHTAMHKMWGGADVLEGGFGIPGWMEGLPRSRAAACQGLLRCWTHMLATLRGMTPEASWLAGH